MGTNVLVTNDDGFDSGFLRVLVEELREVFSVTVAAPDGERSWIGRAVSRHTNLKVVEDDSLGCRGYRISGTPTDCVNLALGCLEIEPPDVVVSGINLGFNTTQPLILSSGTVAGALEGAFWGLPALALSQMIPEGMFEKVHANSHDLEPEFAEGLRWAANRAVKMVRERIGTGGHPPLVHNINFPVGTGPETEVVRTVPAGLKMGCLFEKAGDGDFRFRFSKGTRINDHEGTDIAALERGKISLSVLDFSRFGEL
ncbi:MAG: 5'/3'-nucleotidase SurE [Puniceicoccaceae bacterium]